MRSMDIELKNLVEELLVVLDEDIEHVGVMLGRMDQLREAVIKRDETFLRDLLEAIHDESQIHERIELRRDDVRRRLAEIMGCGEEQMNLSLLCENLEPVMRQTVAEKQSELKPLVEKLNREHILTSMLLKECARLNSMMLRGIFTNSDSSITYNSRGDASWRAHRELVNCRL